MPTHCGGASRSSASTPNLCMKAISHPVRPERSRVAAKSKNSALAHSFKMDALVACAMGTKRAACRADVRAGHAMPSVPLLYGITSKTLFTEALPVGQSWGLAVMRMEKDGGTSQHF